ncbi:hypothetical protein [uncultured Methylobacterium sp.]|uniref:hypothetical protein n=1 Tax=uncultured Methylobacterium sp. TaxID=157278 RepID=UPI0035CBF461
MVKSDLHPPETGFGSDPILYGVAAGLAELFPPVVARAALEPAEADDDADEAERD